jgi:glutamate/aspartate transport system substrate-binding protein
VLRKLNFDRNLGFELLSAKDHANRCCWCSRTAPRPSAWTTSCSTACAPARRTRPSCRWWAKAIQVEPYAIMLRKDDPAFKKLVDDTLVSLIAERAVRSALQEVVPVADPAQGHQPERADEQGAAGQPEGAVGQAGDVAGGCMRRAFS